MGFIETLSNPRRVLETWRERRIKARQDEALDFPVAEDDAMRGFLRFAPEFLRIYLAMSFWTILAWPMVFAHLYVNFGFSPNVGNFIGLTFGGIIEGVLILSSDGDRGIWQAERQYRDLCVTVMWVNVSVVFIRVLLHHWH